MIPNPFWKYMPAGRGRNLNRAVWELSQYDYCFFFEKALTVMLVEGMYIQKIKVKTE